MAINPGISLQVQTPNIAPALNIFENVLMNKQTRDIRGQQAQIQAEQAPLQSQILQQQIDAGNVASQQATDQRILASVNKFATLHEGVINEAERSGDFGRLQELLVQRRAELIQQGLPTETTDEGILMLAQGDIQSLDVIDQLRASRQLFNQQSGQQLTPRLRELQQFKNLPTDTPEQVIFKEQFGKAIGAISKIATTEEKLELEGGKADIAVTKAERITKQKLRAELAAIPEEERVKFLSKNRANFETDIAESRNVLDEIDRAIEIWETAPGTISGPIASRVLSLADDTQELESILAGLGIDRLSAFKGATSERELATAFRAGASIEQDSVAGIRRLKKQRNDLTRNNARLGDLLNESKALLRKQPRPTNNKGDLSAEEQAELEQLEAEIGNP